MVLNQLITNDLNLLPMPNSPKALMWVGMNYTDDEKGVVEKLAVRFRNEKLMQNFDEKVKSIVEVFYDCSNIILIDSFYFSCFVFFRISTLRLVMKFSSLMYLKNLSNNNIEIMKTTKRVTNVTIVTMKKTIITIMMM